LTGTREEGPLLLWKSGLTIIAPLPHFFVSVADKGVSFPASLLFATLAGNFASVASKGVTEAKYS
jgi:hypothetical protein